MRPNPSIAGLFLAGVALAAQDCPPDLAPVYLELAAPLDGGGPCLGPGDRFGQAVCFLDYDADGALDLAVGAPGHGAVFLYFGPLLEGPPEWKAFTSSGALPLNVCPPVASDRFGTSIAAGELDGWPGEELFIGAPDAAAGSGRVFGFGRALGTIVELAPGGSSQPGRMGKQVVVADLDLDGSLDVAAGAPLTDLVVQTPVDLPETHGRVHVFHSGLTAELLVDNPLAGSDPEAANGQFGSQMVVGDGSGDDLADLFVSAPGNPDALLADGGGVYYYAAPVHGPGGVHAPVAIHDVAPLPPELEESGTRYGRATAVRDVNLRPRLLVGANWKDGVHGGVPGTPEQAGGAFFYRGADFAKGRLLADCLGPLPTPERHLGFRAALVDLVGNEQPDFVFSSLGTRQWKVWDAGDLAAGPIVLAGPPGASSHWTLGMDYAQLVPGGKEELAVGDTWYPDGPGGPLHVGRVVVLTMP